MSKIDVETLKKKGIRGWFERRTGKDLWIGVSVVLAAAILSEVTTLLRAGVTASSTGVSAFSYTTLVLGVVVSLGTWVLSSLIIHGSSRLLKGKGSMRRFFAMNGFAYVPILVQSLLSVADVMLSGVSRSPLSSQPILQLLLTQFNLLSLIGIALSAVAVMANYGLNGKRAVVAVLIPVILILALGLLGIPIGVGRSNTFRGFGGLFGRGGGGGFSGAPGG
jgi:hypothetical protein